MVSCSALTLAGLSTVDLYRQTTPNVVALNEIRMILSNILFILGSVSENPS